MQKPAKPRSQTTPRTVDVRTLGRPVHLLQKFMAPFQEDLAGIFQTELNRRYRANFEIGEVRIEQLVEAPARCRWLGFSDEAGRIGVAIERHLLLAILEYRYGSADRGSGRNTSESTLTATRETATEERLAAMLGRQFIRALAARIGSVPDAGLESAPACGFTEVSPQSPRPGTWIVRAAVSETAHQIEGAIWFSLDEAWMRRLFSRVGPARSRTRDRLGSAIPLATRLNITLVARLLEKEVPLGMLLDTRVGDVIPISLGNADVLIEDACIFSARIAEHKGKLCLTGFEDVE